MKSPGFAGYAFLAALLLFLSCTAGTEPDEGQGIEGLTGRTYSDPANDTIGGLEYQHDILSVEVFLEPEAEWLFFRLGFNKAILPNMQSGKLEELFGFLEIDLDQTNLSGSPSNIDVHIIENGTNDPLTGMGVDFTVVLHDYNGLFEMSGIHAPGPDDPLVGFAPIQFRDEECLLSIPLKVLGTDDGSFDFGLFIGTEREATDLTVKYSHALNDG